MISRKKTLSWSSKWSTKWQHWSSTCRSHSCTFSKGQRRKQPTRKMSTSRKYKATRSLSVWLDHCRRQARFSTCQLLRSLAALNLTDCQSWHRKSLMKRAKSKSSSMEQKLLQRINTPWQMSIELGMNLHLLKAGAYSLRTDKCSRKKLITCGNRFMNLINSIDCSSLKMMSGTKSESWSSTWLRTSLLSRMKALNCLCLNVNTVNMSRWRSEK